MLFDYKSTGQKVNLLFGCAKDKDIKDMAVQFKGRFNKIYLTRPGNVKESDIETAKKVFEQNDLNFVCDQDYEKTIKRALNETKEQNGILLVTGSFYLVSEVKKIIE
jgi:dihydrofolate synthase/folylpolyglutamate synthase